MKTYIPTVDPANKKWWVIDLDDAILGRSAVKVSNILRGKNKPIFTPHMDTGDHVVVVNASSVKIKGTNKPDQLRYYSYSGYPSGLRIRSFAEMINNKPEEVFRMAVRRMLPKNRLGRKMIKKLHIYAGPEHPHVAQQPEQLEIK